jgi:hypothetical protein
MGKKKSLKKDKKKAQKVVPETTQTEKSFDFGGLPDRDLKKNLGCG